MYETLDRLKHLPQKIVSEEFLIPEILKLDITEEDMEREHRKQLRRRQQQQQERSWAFIWDVNIDNKHTVSITMHNNSNYSPPHFLFQNFEKFINIIVLD